MSVTLEISNKQQKQLKKKTIRKYNLQISSKIRFGAKDSFRETNLFEQHGKYSLHPNLISPISKR